MVFFFVFWVWTRRPRPIFPSSNSLSAPQVHLTATDVDRRSLRPGTMSLFSRKARQLWTLNNISSPSLLLLREGKKNIQTNDRQMTRQKVSPQFVVDRSSAHPDRDRGQRCSAATFLSNSKYRYRPLTQPDVADCRPGVIIFVGWTQWKRRKLYFSYDTSVEKDFSLPTQQGEIFLRLSAALARCQSFVVLSPVWKALRFGSENRVLALRQ